jgi:hypothetical protein
MRSLLVRSLSLAALLVAACAPPPPPARPAPIMTATAIAPPKPSESIAPAAPPPDPTIVSVAAAPWPLHFALDGDLAEWGSLLPPIPPPPDPAVKKPAADVPDEPPPPPNPRDAASHAAIAVSAEGALIAADLSGSARAGIWLGLGAGASSVPPIGYWQRGGGIAELDCEAPTGTGEPSPPEAIAACHQLIRRHAEFTAAHEARFRAIYRIDSEGIRAVKADGTLAPIEGAKAAFNATPRGATVEIALPPKALPRLSAAPLEVLHLIARIATTPEPPPFAANDWVRLELPAPASFEPWGEIRAKVFEALSTRALYVPSGLSFQPGDPLHVEIVSYDHGIYEATHVAPSEETLYTKKATLGDVEVGLVSAYNDWIAILKKDKLVNLVDLRGNLRGILERDGEIHVLTYAQYTSEVYSETATWSAIAVAADGTFREDVIQQEEGSRAWSQVSEFHSKTLDSFGMRGWSSYGPHGDEGIELTWRWDNAKRSYQRTQRKIPVHKTKVKKP